MSLTGIDVSSYQGAVDWSAVAAAGYSFAFAKASEGVGWEDPYFGRNWAGIGAEGLVRGAYHFGRPENDPILDARYFCGVVGQVGSGDILALDLEQSPYPGDLSGWARTWLDEVHRETGLFPFWYSYPSFIDEHYLPPLFSGPYPAWLVNPRSDWPLYMLQLLSGQFVPGISGVVDIDDYAGRRQDLINLSLTGIRGGDMPLDPNNQYDKAVIDGIAFLVQRVGPHSGEAPADASLSADEQTVYGLLRKVADRVGPKSTEPAADASLTFDTQTMYGLLLQIKEEVGKIPGVDLTGLNSKIDAVTLAVAHINSKFAA